MMKVSANTLLIKGQKNIRLIAFLFILFFLAHCADPVQKQPFKIGFSQCVSDDRWRQTMHQEMERELLFYQGDLKLEIKDAEGNSDTQIRQIEEFIRDGIDLLMVSPNESAPITPIVEKAYNSGIPVIVLDRKTTSSMYTAYVGADSYEIGQIAGRYIQGLVNEGDKVVEIWGLKGSSPAVARSTGFNSEMQADGVSVVQIFADWTKEDAKQRVRAQLDEIKDARIIFAHNDQMALAAFEVFREEGMEPIPMFIGVDALPGPGGGIEMVNEAILDATFLYPTGGDEAIRTAYNILRGLPYDKENILQTTLVDATNVRIMKLQTDEILSQQNEIWRQQNRIAEQIKLYNNQRIALYLLLGFLSLSIVLGASALYALHENRRINNALKSRNEMISAQKEEIQFMADKAEEATNAKFRFFTNISHEFRTPLTLILGPLDGLLQHKKVNMYPEVVHDLRLIRKNANRLLRLVNQLMAFRKLEHNKVRISASEQDIVSFVREIMEDFQSLASKNSIDFQLTSSKPSIMVWFDNNWLDKVIFNLLSNAFKFTPKSGFIHIRIRDNTENQNVVIEVEDNGRGMSPEQGAHAFDRFYSGATYSDMGTGLGLSLSKELIALHDGSISLKSEKNIGTTFYVTLPIGNAHFTEDERSETTSQPGSYQHDTLVHDDFELAEEVADEPSPAGETSVLMVEDNRELSLYLKTRLSKSFQVLTAFDGEQGLEMAVQHVPDIIICDIMIPKKDGIAVTSSLKTDSRTSHIPIILLTAKSEDEHLIKGIKAGADVYITKPFNYEYLSENINNLLHTRAMLKSHYLGVAFGDEEIQDHAMTIKDPDKEFVQRFKALVQDKLHDTEFNVNEICREMGFSRVQLYRKVNALLDSPVNDYINTLRLRRAMKLLKTSEMNVSDIAYACGFSSPTYFSTAFKNYYKVPPSDVRKG